MKSFRHLTLRSLIGGIVVLLLGLVVLNYAMTDRQGNTIDELLMAVYALCILLAGGLLLQRIVKPIERIRAAAERIAAGELAVQVKDTDQNEIGAIARAINTLGRNLNNAGEFIRHIENGNLEATYEGAQPQEASRTGLTGALLSMREQMRNIARQEQQRNWVTQGLARFGELLHSHHEDVAAMSNALLPGLVRYLNAKQGALFILHDDGHNEWLEMAACYAYDRRKFLHKKILPGQGLVGQVFREKDTLYLTDIPADYVRIRSGIGETLPTCLVLVPMQTNERVYGVLEIASLQALLPHQIEFLEKLGESIGSAVATVRTNEKTRRLLNESQSLTVQMQEQEEKMRRDLLRATDRQQALLQENNRNAELIRQQAAQRQEDQEKLAAATARLLQLDILADTSPEALLLADAPGDIVAVNVAGRKLLGEGIRGHSLHKLLPIEAITQLQGAALHEYVTLEEVSLQVNGEARALRVALTGRRLLLNGDPVFSLALSDLREQRTARQAHRQVQQMQQELFEKDFELKRTKTKLRQQEEALRITEYELDELKQMMVLAFSDREKSPVSRSPTAK